MLPQGLHHVLACLSLRLQCLSYGSKYPILFIFVSMIHSPIHGTWDVLDKLSWNKWSNRWMRRKGSRGKKLVWIGDDGLGIRRECLEGEVLLSGRVSRLWLLQHRLLAIEVSEALLTLSSETRAFWSHLLLVVRVHTAPVLFMPYFLKSSHFHQQKVSENSHNNQTYTMQSEMRCNPSTWYWLKYGSWAAWMYPFPTEPFVKGWEKPTNL